MPNASPLTLLIGATVGWPGRGGETLTGKVTCYHHKGRKLNLQVRRPDGSHLWFIADVSKSETSGSFKIIRHGADSVEYGLHLADQILRGKGSSSLIGPELTTLAATIQALETQLNALSGASETDLNTNQQGACS